MPSALLNASSLTLSFGPQKFTVALCLTEKKTKGPHCATPVPYYAALVSKAGHRPGYSSSHTGYRTRARFSLGSIRASSPQGRPLKCRTASLHPLFLIGVHLATGRPSSQGCLNLRRSTRLPQSPVCSGFFFELLFDGCVIACHHQTSCRREGSADEVNQIRSLLL